MTASHSQLLPEQLTESGEVFASARNVTDKGLQQYFTPPPLAALFASVMACPHVFTVADLTAGSGNLLSAFAEYERVHSFGIELDHRFRNREVGIEEANLLRAFPYLRELEVRFDKLILNPPFGLKWTWQDKQVNSAALTLRLGCDLLDDSGEGVCILDERNLPEVLDELRTAGCEPYYVWHISNLFAPASAVKCAVVWFYKGERELTCQEESFDFGQFKKLTPSLERKLLQARKPLWFTYSDSEAARETRTAFSACCKAARDEAAAAGQAYTIELSGKQLRVRLSDFQALSISKSHGESWFARIRQWNGRTLSYFALNSIELDAVSEALAEKIITAQPGFTQLLQEALFASEKHTAPFYPLKVTQRLGYLDKLDKIRCTKTDKSKKLRAGELYAISVSSHVWEERGEKIVKRFRDGAPSEEKRDTISSGKKLRIEIAGHEFDETPEDIQYLTDHFDIPDPGDVATHFPQDYARYLSELRRLETPRFQFREFQRDDLARLLCRGNGVLAWEQGLGKMLGALAWHITRGFKRILLIVPQDLIPQWTTEAESKFGIKLIRLQTIREARLLAKRPKPGPHKEPEVYITHYEALSRNGSTCEMLPEVQWLNCAEMDRRWDYETRKHIKTPIYNTNKGYCPHCHQQHSWNGKRCDPRKVLKHHGHEQRGCGYTHYRLRVHNMAHYLKKTFSAVVVDEGTKIKGDRSQMGLAVRSLRPRARLILTGTPVKNFLYDSYWLLWWAAGGTATSAFPYGYTDKGRFTEDFCVQEWEAPQESNGYKKGAVRARPEICNLSMLWKTLGPNILRRRKSEIGEALVGKRLVPVRVPFAVQQQEVYWWWLNSFGEWYTARPGVNIKNAHLADLLAGLLGQLWKLRFAASTPASERLSEHNGRRAESSHTPKLLACLRLIREALESGESVVVFNTMKDSTRLIQTELIRAGISSRIVDGDVKPAERARVIQEFKSGKFPVLLAGLEAVNLGHNLETARRCIVYSLPFDLAGFDQAVNRIHRLTSERDVLIHVLLTQGSIDERMWDLVQRKGQSAGLALDGALGYDDIQEIDWNKFAAELREEFRRGEAVPESVVTQQIAEVWHGLNLHTDPAGRQRASSGLMDSIAASISITL